MKKVILFLAMVSLLASAQTNILRNPLFEGEDGKLPAPWGASRTGTVRRIPTPGGLAQAPQFALEVSNDDAQVNAHAIQTELKEIVVNQNYLFTVDFKGAAGTIVQLYVERSSPTYKSFLKTYTCDGSWQKAIVEFRYTELQSQPYAVFRVKGAGSACFTAPRLYLDRSQFNNGDFELGIQNWNISSGSIVELDDKHRHVLELKNLQGPAKATQASIRLTGGQLYKLSYEASGGTDKHYTDNQGATWFRITPQINGKPFPGTDVWKDSFPNWQTKRLTFKPEKDQDVDIVCELRAPGSVRFDNLVLEPCKSDIPLLEIMTLPPFSHGNACFLPQPQGVAQFTVKLLTELSAARFQIDFQGKTQWFTASKNMQITLPLPTTPGRYPVKAVAVDAQNKPLASAELVFSVHPPSSGRTVTFRDDHVMLVDGQPFFPLAVWSVNGTIPFEERYKRIADAGFNAAKCDMQHIANYANVGLFAIASVPAALPKYDTPQQFEQWKRSFLNRFKRVRANPNLLAYFNIDEPCWNGRPYQPIQEAYQFIREYDPYHPMYLNEAPRSTIDDLRAYAAAADAYGVDIYPIPSPNSHSELADKTMTSVGKYTDISREVVRDNKPVWMTLQAFAWNQLHHLEPRIYPTHEENRFMAYDAIVHGATGLFYWGFNHGFENWDFISELGRTVRELNEYSGILTARNVSPSPFKANAEVLHFLHKRIDGNDFYIVVNDSDQPLNAAFTGTDLPPVLHVLKENRTVQTDGHAFTDTFKPYDIHLYATTANPPPPCKLAPIPSDKQFQCTNDFRQANWIWFPKMSQTANSQAYFIRDFEIPKDMVKAELQITADDLFRAYINGQLSLEHNKNGQGHSNISVLDITKKLVPGRNRLAVHAADAGQPPCALLYALRLTDKQGRVTQIFSDDATLCSQQVPPNWASPAFVPKDWIPSEVINQYGFGPWGCNAIPEAADLQDLGLFDFP